MGNGMAFKVATGILIAWGLIVALQTVAGTIYEICCVLDPAAQQMKEYREELEYQRKLKELAN